MAKRGLGKGIDSLIPVQTVDEQKRENGNIKEIVKQIEVIKEVRVPVDAYIKIREIESNREQPRKQFDEKALGELADSIKQYGIIQPIIVEKKEMHYEIIAGERRWRAAQIAGLKEVPVLIRSYGEQEKKEIALIENIQRENLNPIEEANAFQSLLEEYKLTQEEVAKRVGKGRASITNALRLLKLCPKVQEKLADGLISTGHAKVLLAVEDPEIQIEISHQIEEKNLSVRDTEKIIKSILNPTSKKKKMELNNEEVYLALEEKMKNKMGTKVCIHRKNNQKGKIEIEYYSEDDLERIIELMGIF